MNFKTLCLTLAVIALLCLVLVVRETLSSGASSPAATPASMTPAQPLVAVPSTRARPALAASAGKKSTAERKYFFTLDRTAARIGKEGKWQSSSDGLFDRAFISATGPTEVEVFVPEFLAGEEVTVTAPNGGKLSRKGGDLRFTPQSEGGVQLDLTFEPTMGRGVYTISIRQAGALTTLDFWAGEINPTGQPGPSYVAAPTIEASTENIP